MTYCKVYCGVPPESVDKCEMLRPQLVRIHANARKNINFKIFDTCNESTSRNGSKPVLSSASKVIINIANRFVPNLFKRTVVEDSVRWSIIDNSGIIQCSGESPINTDNTFVVNIPRLNIPEGYYRLTISRETDVSDSYCSLKLFVCA